MTEQETCTKLPLEEMVHIYILRSSLPATTQFPGHLYVTSADGTFIDMTLYTPQLWKCEEDQDNMSHTRQLTAAKNKESSMPFPVGTEVVIAPIHDTNHMRSSMVIGVYTFTLGTCAKLLDAYTKEYAGHTAASDELHAIHQARLAELKKQYDDAIAAENIDHAKNMKGQDAKRPTIDSVIGRAFDFK